jgi:serine/threonine protein kinase
VNDWSRCPACGKKVKSGETSCPTCEAALSAATTQEVVDDSPGTSSLFKKDKIAAELKDALAPGIQVLRRFGAGAMSTLYLGRDPALRRLVAIKVLSKDLAKDSVARARFTREAESAAAVSHPHVVGIYQVGKLPESNVPYIVMQFVDGKTLQQELLSDKIMPEARAKRIVGEVASALATAHERGLVHRDIKPANILMDREGGRAVVLDFGISAALDRTSLAGSEKLTIQGMAVGTPIYMSPEQAAAKEVTDRSDVYSLGTVAFELVTGRPPFNADSPEGYIAAHVGEQPPDLGELRPDLDPQFSWTRADSRAGVGDARLLGCGDRDGAFLLCAAVVRPEWGDPSQWGHWSTCSRLVLLFANGPDRNVPGGSCHAGDRREACVPAQGRSCRWVPVVRGGARRPRPTA